MIEKNKVMLALGVVGLIGVFVGYGIGGSMKGNIKQGAQTISYPNPFDVRTDQPPIEGRSTKNYNVFSGPINPHNPEPAQVPIIFVQDDDCWVYDDPVGNSNIVDLIFQYQGIWNGTDCLNTAARGSVGNSSENRNIPNGSGPLGIFTVHGSNGTCQIWSGTFNPQQPANTSTWGTATYTYPPGGVWNSTAGTCDAP